MMPEQNIISILGIFPRHRSTLWIMAARILARHHNQSKMILIIIFENLKQVRATEQNPALAQYSFPANGVSSLKIPGNPYMSFRPFSQSCPDTVLWNVALLS